MFKYFSRKSSDFLFNILFEAISVLISIFSKNKRNTTISGQVVFEYNNETIEEPALNGNDTLKFGTSVGIKLSQEIVNSFDPNDKTCLEEKTITPQIIGEYLYYMIRFENTGTAEAVNIIVRDTIDSEKFDMNRRQLTDQSHSCRIILTDNLLELKCDNINLPFQDPTNDGYMTFKIKTLPTLRLGDTFENTAGIYFNFNHPDITDTSSTEVAVEKEETYSNNSSINLGN